MQVNCSDRLSLIRWTEIEKYMSGKVNRAVYLEWDEVGVYIGVRIDEVLRYLVEHEDKYGVAVFTYLNGPSTIIASTRGALDFAIRVVNEEPKHSDDYELEPAEQVFHEAALKLYKAAKASNTVDAIGFAVSCKRGVVVAKAVIDDKLLTLAEEKLVTECEDGLCVFEYECIPQNPYNIEAIRRAAENAVRKLTILVV